MNAPGDIDEMRLPFKYLCTAKTGERCKEAISASNRTYSDVRAPRPLKARLGRVVIMLPLRYLVVDDMSMAYETYTYELFTVSAVEEDPKTFH